MFQCVKRRGLVHYTSKQLDLLAAIARSPRNSVYDAMYSTCDHAHVVGASRYRAFMALPTTKDAPQARRATGTIAMHPNLHYDEFTLHFLYLIRLTNPLSMRR